MNLATIDFQQLRIKHILYKSKVRSVLYGGTYDVDFFSRSGPVSTWINSVAMPKYGSEAEMRQLANIHQELNHMAHHLYIMYKNGHIDQARDGLKDIEKKSDQFINTLSKLENKFR